MIDYVLEPVCIAQRKSETRIDVASSKRRETTRHGNVSGHLADSSHDDPAEKAHEGIRDHDGCGTRFDERATCANDQAGSDSTTFEANVLARDCVVS